MSKKEHNLKQDEHAERRRLAQEQDILVDEENVFTRKKSAKKEMYTKRRIFLSTLVGVALVVGSYYWWSAHNSFSLPAEQPQETTMTINDHQHKDILDTQDIKHSIPLEDIISGGVLKDGIPPINDPFFVSTAQAPEWLGDKIEGISFVSGTTQRFYPFSVLVAHEIVNDTIDEKRVLVTYCPLCLTGIVFDPTVDGVQVEFGVSGKLWNSNLLMYNRDNPDKESLWSQITGEGVVGEHTGVQLEILPSDIVTFGSWKGAHPQGEILVGHDGRLESYTRNPYGENGNFRDIARIFDVANKDERLAERAIVFGIEIDGVFKAYEESAIRGAEKNIEDEFAGKNLVVGVDPKEDAVRIYEIAADGTRTRIQAIPSFWFAWAAVHPETDVYTATEQTDTEK